MTDGYDLTISGLVRKRIELLQELEALRERSTAVTNTIRSLDRVLLALGFKDDLASIRAPAPRTFLFARHELRRFILDQLRTTDVPLSSRQLANLMALADGRDPNDRGLMVEIVKRVSRSVAILFRRGMLHRSKDEVGDYVYKLAHEPASDHI